MAAELDRVLVFEDFADKVGEGFTVSEEGMPGIPLTLTEAAPLDPAKGLSGVRPPFSLTFLSKDSRVLPQRLYRLVHDRLSGVTIFLVPSAKNSDGVSYHATFN
jgi:hypothetical protein